MKKKLQLNAKKIIAVAMCDLVALTISMLLSLLIVHNEINWCIDLLYWYLTNIVVVYFFFIFFRLYYLVFNSFGLIDSFRVVAAMACVFIVNLLLILAYKDVCSINTCIVYCVALGIFSLLIRSSKRIVNSVRYIIHGDKKRVRAMIVGAGDAGTTIIREIQNTDKIDYYPVCIVDDDVTKTGKSISGVKVVGTTEEIKKFAERYNVKEILIAMPSVPKVQIKRIFSICKTTDCKVKILPGIYQIVNGEASVSSLRPVQISDLLGREQIKV
ncbi:MAG: nucleoside-diphosphate sugar epimerase/dehydratase, partial [Candidatus Coproplasma sp.]